MKKTAFLTGLILLLATTPAMAQMMGGGQHMYQQQREAPQQQYNPYQMNPGMMRGSGMGPGMMGGYGYGMPYMMGGYGMGPGMMGGYGYGMHGSCGGWQGSYFKSQEDYIKFIDETRETRRKMHSLMFDYNELRRSPEPDLEKLQQMEKEMNDLRNKISNYKTNK